MTREQWSSLTLAEQLGNIGSDFDRALRWQATGNHSLFQSAAARTMQLLDLTVADPRWQGSRLAELTRVRDEVAAVLRKSPASANSGQSVQRYFLEMATRARRER